MIARLCVLAAAAAAIAACGSASDAGAGAATLWVTRDRGAEVLVEARIESGQTAMQALDRETELETRYGGRYVQSVNGIDGSLRGGVDWFYFVNGYEGDRSAAEYRVHAGDVIWFDYRDWRTRMSEPIVVGAFPQPFRSGFGGRRRDAVVEFDEPLREEAMGLALVVGGDAVPCCRAIDSDANVLRLKAAEDGEAERFVGRHRGASSAPGAPVEFTLTARAGGVDDVVRRARHRYRWTGAR